MGNHRFSVVAALLLLAFSPEVRAQILDLEIKPNPASTLEPVDLLFGFPWFASSQTFEVVTRVVGTVIMVDVVVTSQPSGLPLLVFSLETVGPLAPREYEVVVNYRVDGVLEASETSILVVQPVRAVPVLDSPVSLGFLALLLLTAALGKRGARRLAVS